MSISTSKGAVLALLLAFKVSAYKLSFYSDASCSSSSTWQHSATNDTTYTTPCEAIPAAAGSRIRSAGITSEPTDQHWAYTAQLFSDAACSSPITTISTEEGCIATGSVLGFIVVGTESDFVMPEGTWDAVSYTVNTVNSIGGNVVSNETQSEYYTTNGGDDDQGSSGGSGILGGSSPVIYPMDDASLEYAISNDDEAGVPGGADEAILDAPCDDTVKTNIYNVDQNEDGLADGRIVEQTTFNPNGGIVAYKKKTTNRGQNIPGAVMKGPLVNTNPTFNHPRDPDPVLDEGSSGTSTSTGWPAAVLKRM
ncbi:hypothetical protein TWF281_011103 [Arthrobotrys megalospora]